MEKDDIDRIHEISQQVTSLILSYGEENQPMPYAVLMGILEMSKASLIATWMERTHNFMRVLPPEALDG